MPHKWKTIHFYEILFFIIINNLGVCTSFLLISKLNQATKFQILFE